MPNLMNCEHQPSGRCAECEALFAPVSGLAAVERESRFYREQLELICKDSRKTRARRLAESALTFWDSLKAEAAKRKEAEAANNDYASTGNIIKPAKP